MKNLNVGLWVLVCWVCATLVLRADVVNVLYIGGEVQMPSTNEVVLELDLTPKNLEALARTRTHLQTWGDLSRNLGTMELTFKVGVYFKEGDQKVHLDSVEFPGIADQPSDAPLPKFVPVRLKWSKVPVIQTALGPASFAVDLTALGMNSIQFVLKNNLPWWRALPQSIMIGYQHILPFGLDHILFVLGIYLSARRFRDLFWQVTCFTLAHSITLGLTISGVLIVGWFWQQFVELGIALSIAAVAFENCIWRRPPGATRLAIVSAFGLIHGMGFAGQLSEVKWPDNFFYLTLFGANLGIELGQLTVVALASLVTAWWWRRDWYGERIGVPMSFLVGLYGMFVTMDRLSNLLNPPKQLADDLWKWYDLHYGWVPVLLAIVSLAAFWILFRLILRMPHLARWLLAET